MRLFCRKRAKMQFDSGLCREPPGDLQMKLNADADGARLCPPDQSQCVDCGGRPENFKRLVSAGVLRPDF
jgi:hypothetical protein